MARAPQTDWTETQVRFSEYLQGNQTSTRIVFETLAKALKPFFYARTRSEEASEDLTQATLLKIHFARDRFDLERSLKTWVFTIAGRCLIDHWRGTDFDPLRTSKSITPSEDEGQDPEILGLASTELDLAQKFELMSDLNQSLNTLKPDDRSIVYLYAVEGFSMAEVAQTLGLTESAVKVRAHRSYQKIREQLK